MKNKKTIKNNLLNISNAINMLLINLLYPINLFLSKIKKNIYNKNSVLHISFLVHIPYYTTRLLHKKGIKADYFAIGKSKVWDKCDYNIPYPIIPFISIFIEMYWFWKVVSKYEVIHSHFERTISYNGWELKFLKKMGRKIVIHHRGCHSRDRFLNEKINPDPDFNICSECDYNYESCSKKIIMKRRKNSIKYGDIFLVTTPDLKDFVKNSIHYPFFSPEITDQEYLNFKKKKNQKSEIKIVHATNHPGIEGTEKIIEVINRLKDRGFKINFVFLKGVPHSKVLKEMEDADLTIGKMKMGYYANAQIESMALGVPAITYIRPEYMTRELEDSGFIICSLKTLEKTLLCYLQNPGDIHKKSLIARKSILDIHNNDYLTDLLVDLYSFDNN